MSQAHMLASVPDLLVSPVGHATQQGAECAPVCCVCVYVKKKKTMMKTCRKCTKHHIWMRDESVPHVTFPALRTHMGISTACMCVYQ